MTDNADVLKRIKSISSIENQDDTLNGVIDVLKSRLAVKLGLKDGEEPPKSLSYILVEASISRFNRINDEGKSSSSENSVSATWQTDDLAPFADDISEWVKVNEPKDSKKVVRLL